MIVCILNIMWWKLYFTSVVFYSKPDLSLILKKKSDKSQLRGAILQNSWPVSLKSVKVIITRNARRTVTAEGSLKSMPTEYGKGQEGTTEKIWINSGLELMIMYRYWFIKKCWEIKGVNPRFFIQWKYHFGMKIK